MARKRMLTLLLTLCMLSALFVPACAESFSDIDSSIGSSYVDAINYMSDNGIIQGWEDGTYRPNVSISRAMAVTILFRMSGDGGTYSNASQFTDVSRYSVYYNAIGWAVAKGISNGVTTTTFEPNSPVQRQQLMVMLYRFAGYKGCSQTVTENMSGYTDYSSVGNFAKTAVAWAYSYAIPYNGTNTHVINPLGDVARKDMAIFGINYRHNVEGIVFGRDTFRFINSSSDFASGSADKYLMSNADWNTFKSAVNRLGFINSPQTVDSFMVSTPWNGSCFGMAAALALDYSGKIDLNGNFCNSAPSIYDIPRLSDVTNSKHQRVTTPVEQGSLTISAAESKINFYQLSQYFTEIFNWIVVKNNAVDTVLRQMVSEQANGGIGVFSYTQPGRNGGHAINVYGVPERTSNGFRVPIYDNRSLSSNGYIEIVVSNGKYSGTVVTYIYGYEYREAIAKCKYTNDLNNFITYGLDIDGEFNTNANANSSIARVFEDYTLLRVKSEDDFSVVDAGGNTLTMQNGEINGSIDVYCYNFIVFGEDSPCEYLFIVPKSDSYRCSADDGKLMMFYTIDNDGMFGTSIYEDNCVELSSIDISKTGNVEVNKAGGLDIS